jgi:hypothetical protein
MLLFRSGKTRRHPTREEVLLKDVRAMEVRCWSSGLRIEEVSLEYLVRFDSNPVEMVQPGNRVYSVQGEGWKGFIVGGAVVTHRDEEEFTGRSPLLDDASTGGSI